MSAVETTILINHEKLSKLQTNLQILSTFKKPDHKSIKAVYIYWENYPQKFPIANYRRKYVQNCHSLKSSLLLLLYAKK